ncbi:MAG: FtsB family cell division protein [Lutibacter sp.]
MSFKQLKNKPIVKFITNKYIILLVVFLIWMFFFDENSVLMHYDFQKEIRKLNHEKEYFQQEISNDKTLIDSLQNPKNLEKFAREKYFMKKDSEDIFLIEYDTLKKSK